MTETTTTIKMRTKSELYDELGISRTTFWRKCKTLFTDSSAPISWEEFVKLRLLNGEIQKFILRNIV